MYVLDMQIPQRRLPIEEWYQAGESRSIPPSSIVLPYDADAGELRRTHHAEALGYRREVRKLPAGYLESVKAESAVS